MDNIGYTYNYRQMKYNKMLHVQNALFTSFIKLTLYNLQWNGSVLDI